MKPNRLLNDGNLSVPYAAHRAGGGGRRRRVVLMIWASRQTPKAWSMNTQWMTDKLSKDEWTLKRWWMNSQRMIDKLSKDDRWTLKGWSMRWDERVWRKLWQSERRRMLETEEGWQSVSEDNQRSDLHGGAAFGAGMAHDDDDDGTIVDYFKLLFPGKICESENYVWKMNETVWDRMCESDKFWIKFMKVKTVWDKRWSNISSKKEYEKQWINEKLTNTDDMCQQWTSNTWLWNKRR